MQTDLFLNFSFYCKVIHTVLIGVIIFLSFLSQEFVSVLNTNSAETLVLLSDLWIVWSVLNVSEC